MTVHLIRDLESLHHDLLSMCAIVEEMVHQAVDGLAEPSDELAARLASRDDEIDQWDVRIEEECLKMLALHHPVAIDLRRITSVMKMAGELERVADLAVHIAERAAGLVGWTEAGIHERLRHMAQMAVDMLHRSIDSYVNLDSTLARRVCVADADVDQQNREIIRELTSTIKRSPDLVDPALNLFSASRHIERIADHATNIAEDVVYLVEGEIIRHRESNGQTDDIGHRG
ncbi:MAG TPA: phosphate signaling complex protein PhoU [Planctomycetaceae bacterium]|nr:phosphate signaling complex protein PhoU [Planctomycetaceae bacterium]